MTRLLAYQPMDAEINVWTTVEMAVALADLQLVVEDDIKMGFVHFRRGVVKVYPYGFNATKPLTTYCDYTLSDGTEIAVPTIDGHFAKGEWDKADVFNLVLESDGSKTDVKAYVMNDTVNLYVAIVGQIPHNGFVSFNVYKEGAYEPEKLDAPCVDALGNEHWDTLAYNADTKLFTDHTRIDGAALIDSAATTKVFIQLIGANGKALRQRGSLLAYLSDDADGGSIVAGMFPSEEPSDGVDIGTDGLLIRMPTGPFEGSWYFNSIFRLVSESDGDIDINILESGTKTFYLVLVLESGKLVVSDAIEFPAFISA